MGLLDGLAACAWHVGAVLLGWVYAVTGRNPLEPMLNVVD